MSTPNLDQSAIDLLFEGSSTEQQLTPVNFQTRKSLTPNQMQLLAVENQVFCRSISVRLSSWLSADAKVSLLAAERMLFSEYLETNEMTTMYLGEARLLATQPALVSWSSDFVSPIINLVLGGPANRAEDAAHRDLTPVDTAVMDILLNMIWTDLNYSWASLALNPSNINSVHAANVGKAFLHTEYLLIFTYEMKIENIEGVLQLALSTTVADTLLRELDRQEPSHAQSAETKELLHLRLGHTLHKLHLSSPRFQLHVADILGLVPGRLLPCGSASSPVAHLGITGGKLMNAVPSQRNGRIVARIVETDN